jgi:hypothetical protein
MTLHKNILMYMHRWHFFSPIVALRTVTGNLNFCIVVVVDAAASAAVDAADVAAAVVAKLPCTFILYLC